MLACGALGEIERSLDALGDEGEGRASFHLERLARVMGDDEHGMMEGRIGAPPAFPRRRGIPRPGMSAEHVSAHHRGTDMGEAFLHDLSALVHLSAFETEKRAKGRKLKGPGVKALAAFAERPFDALLGTGDVAVERHGNSQAKLRHGVLRTGGRFLFHAGIIDDRGR